MSDSGRPDELGAHVSVAGGVERAPARAAAIGAVVLQLFTKQPSRWAEPELSKETIAAFHVERAKHSIRVAGAHDSYLINLSTPDRRLWTMSQRSLEAELRRCSALALDFLVTHPGNATDGREDEGIRRNARGLAQCLEAVEGETRVLLELTSGSGTSVGGSFERLRAIREELPRSLRPRVGVCLDTCHAFSAGYDLASNYDEVWKAFDAVLGFELLGLVHVNDSKDPVGSHRDRHETIGEGTLGTEPFRRLVLDDRLRRVPKILETPKGDDAVSADRGNLALLRELRDGG